MPKHWLLHFPQCIVWDWQMGRRTDMLTHFWCAGLRSAALSCFSPWLASVAVGGGQTRCKTGSADRQTGSERWTVGQVLPSVSSWHSWPDCLCSGCVWWHYRLTHRETDSEEVRNMLLIFNSVLLQIFAKYYNIVLRDTSGFGFSQ